MGLEAGSYGPLNEADITPEMRERADAVIKQAIEDGRDHAHRVLDVALNECKTPEEVFALRDMIVSLNGLLLRRKEA